MVKSPIFQKYVTITNLHATNYRTSNIYITKIDHSVGDTAKFTISLGNFNTPIW